MDGKLSKKSQGEFTLDHIRRITALLDYGPLTSCTGIGIIMGRADSIGSMDEHCEWDEILDTNRVKVMKLRTPGKFGHTCANSRNADGTALYEPSHQGFYCLLS